MRQPPSLPGEWQELAAIWRARANCIRSARYAPDSKLADAHKRSTRGCRSKPAPPTKGTTTMTNEEKAAAVLDYQMNKIRKANNNRKALIGFVILGFVAYAFGSNDPHPSSKAAGAAAASSAVTTTASPSCSNDWKVCKDNAELMNSDNFAVIEASAYCKIEADHQSKYGDGGSWGWIKFGKFYPGDDYIKTGVMTTIDDHVTFANQYGAQVKSEVICRYDMNSKKVLSVSVNEQ